MNPPILHVFTVKYLPATNTQGSRFKVASARFSDSITLPFDYSLNNIEEMACKVLAERGFSIVGIMEGYVVSDTFKALKA
jgi:hypothetical protein